MDVQLNIHSKGFLFSNDPVAFLLCREGTLFSGFRIPCSGVSIFRIPCSSVSIFRIPCSGVSIFRIPCSGVSIFRIPCSGVH